MEKGCTVYEGWVYGIGEWSFSKVNKLLNNTFETVSYQHMDGSGAIYVSGAAPMFEEDEENRSSVFDLLAEVVDEDGKGIIIGKDWSPHGTLSLTAYDFTHKDWSSRTIDV